MTTAPLAHSDSLTHSDTLVLDYLAALWAASDDLPPGARDDLMSTVTGYISLRHDLADDPAQVIARLGPPEQLADAVRRGGMPTHLRLPALVPAPSRPARSAGTGADHAAIALLIGGSFVLPVVGPGAGMLIATGSSSWTPAQKAAGWVLTTGSVAGALMTALVIAGFDTGLGMLVLYLGACAGSVLAGLALLAGLRQRS